MKNKKNLLISLFIAFLLFSGGYVLGYARSLPTGNILPQITNKFSQKPVDFGLFWKAWDTVNDKFDGNLDPQKMLYGAISGMVQSTGDPYTEFFTPDEAKNFENDLSGTFSGIGAEIGIKNDKLTVIAPLPDSPAAKAGLKAGDYIKKINDESTTGMPVDTAVMKIRGQEGTDVKLTISRADKDQDYTIKRAKIDVKSVKYSIDNGILKITVSRFDKDTATLIREAEDAGMSQNVRGVVLDLRNNPGGLLDSAIDVSSEFIEKGTVVSEKEEKSGKSTASKASGNGKMTDKGKYPLVVLINKGSASASEIVAGAIHDNGRGQLVGEKSFGKGSVQELENLPDGSELKITVAHWYTPKNININKAGITPDVVVELTDADFNANRDPQMDKALEILK
ncbi:MAG: S41 family peptidase [bacterium]|nr:S41 family peptidase [bacterium]